tara:strand:- start:272377 stop:273633 length:1257 start_codon:yes stop_codon:yes gene_type:complete
MPNQALPSLTLQFSAVLMALGLYGLFGQPTPDNIGVIEILIAALLLFGAGVHGLSAFVLKPNSNQADHQLNSWYSAAQCFAVFGLTIPVLMALFSGANIAELLRDLIAFVFLLLPLLYAHLYKEGRGFRRLFLFGVVFIGIAFSARIFLPLIFPHMGMANAVSLYLTITPAVLFAALYLLAASFLRITARHGSALYNMGFGFLIAAVAVLPLLATGFALQRASVAAVLIFGVLLSIYILIYRPETALRLVVLFAVLFIACHPYIHDVFMRLELKHIQVGFNSRGAELRKVIELGTHDIGHFLFGYGWGAQFENPAVGKMNVGYTHNIFSYYFFKTGLVGFAMLSFYLLAILRNNMKLMRINLPLALSLLLPLLISSVFYASHKAFSFGLLLLLVCAITRRTSLSSVEDARDLVYSNRS